MATPSWGDNKKIKLIYELCATLNETCDVNFEVDHIYPLQGETSKGLHVWYNLMIIPRSLNRSKGNKVLENKTFPRVSNNFDDYLLELKMYAELARNEVQELWDKKPVG